MDQAGEADAWDMARGAVDAFEIPDRFCSAYHELVDGRHSMMRERFSRLRIDLIQESTTIFFCEDTSKPPWLVFERLNILNIDDQDITRFRRLDLEWTRQIMHTSEIDVANVVCTVVIANLSSGPVYAFDLDSLVILDRAAKGN